MSILVAARRRWWLVVPLVAISAMVGAWHSKNSPRRYSASANVRVRPPQTYLAGMQQPGGMDWRVNRLVSEQEVIRSEVIARRVVDTLGLRAEITSEKPLWRHTIFGYESPVVHDSAASTTLTIVFDEQTFSIREGATDFGSAPYGGRVTARQVTIPVPQRPQIVEREVDVQIVPVDVAIGRHLSPLQTGSIEDTDIITLSYSGSDPYAAAMITNAVAREYAAFSREIQETNAQKRTVFLEASLRRQDSVMRVASESLAAFQKRHEIADVAQEHVAIQQRILEIEGFREGIVRQQTVYQTLVGRLADGNMTDEELRSLGGTEAVKDNPLVISYYTKWLELKAERQKLEANYTPSWDGIRNLDSLIAKTRSDLQQAAGLYLRSLQSQLGSYDKSLEALRRNAAKYPPLVAQEMALKGNLTTLREQYSSLLSERQLAGMGETADAGTVQVLKLAAPNLTPVSPDHQRNVLLAVALGILVGLGVAVLLDRLDDSVRSPAELQEGMGLPVLAMIPSSKGLDKTRGKDEGPITLVTHADPRSPVAEAYRSLRTNLAFARARHELETIVVTSPGPSDGKSTTVANLATTFALQGQRTLVIDADLRRAVLDRTFGVNRSPGLSEVAAGMATFAEAVQPTAVERLFVLASGAFPPNPSELLGSAAMRDVIAEAKAGFDVILFDSPPVLAVTDAAVLSTMVDGTILVVRAGSTAREAVRRTLAQLRAVHGRLLGGVMNGVDARGAGRYGGYGYYYYYSYYGSESSGNGNGSGNGVLGRLKRLTGGRVEHD
jgi:tyrosine-protein kinase Etk/Wzc